MITIIYPFVRVLRRYTAHLWYLRQILSIRNYAVNYIHVFHVINCLHVLPKVAPFHYFQIMGCVVLGVGIYALVDGQALMDLVNTQTDVTLTVFTSAAYILIAVSVLVVIVSFFGCCGAIKENRCMLGTYFTVILLMFITLIVGSVIGYATSIDKVEDAIEKTMEKFKDNPDNAKDDEKAITAAWNTVQKDVRKKKFKMVTKKNQFLFSHLVCLLWKFLQQNT